MKKQLVSLNIAIHCLANKKVRNLMETYNFGFQGAEYKKQENHKCKQQQFYVNWDSAAVVPTVVSTWRAGP